MKKSSKKSEIQHILTNYLVLLISGTLGIVCVFFLVIQYNTMKNAAIDNLETSCRSVAENIDLQALQLDTIALNTINSQNMKMAAQKFGSSAQNEDSDYSQNRQRISSILLSFKGFDFTVRQLNAYPIDGPGYAVGDYTGVMKSPDQYEWYKGALSANGRMYIPQVKSHNDLFSIYRAYYNIYHEIIGFVEVSKRYNDFFHEALHYMEINDSTVVIYDENNNIVFPTADLTDREIFPYLEHRPANSDITKVRNTITGQTEFATFYDMSNINFTVVMAVESKGLMTPVTQSIITIVLAFLFVYILGILISRYVAAKVSNPIRSIYHFLERQNENKNSKEENNKLLMDPTDIVEIDKLINSINGYIETSEEQTNLILSLNQQEMQAQMLALQSQMNPHFLYNSLASISEMAREGFTESVTKMTVNISQILRYISSNKQQVTTIEEELELCNMYLECMKLRFGDDIKYNFSVEDEILDFYIPKLCVQLLVENAIKSVTKNSAPWNIEIHGYVDDDKWYIEVFDNGPGFDSDVDKNLRSQMDTILETKTLPSLKIEGMGLLNIFIRFYLLDGISFLFDFGNREEGGAFVKIGRRLEDSYEKN